MYSKTLLLISSIQIISSVNSDNSSASNICDKCLCQYKDGLNQDFLGEKVDCSHIPDILNTNYSLPSTVYSLDLSTNSLKVINCSNVLTDTAMKELLLNHNEISSIDPNSFNLPELRRLDLSYNQLEFIHEDVYKRLNKLEYLNIANNNFSQLKLHHLNNLRELILDNNNLGTSLKQLNLFNRDGFGLTNTIKHLSIRGVKLDGVPENFFSDTYDLKKLVISNNGLIEMFEIPYTLEYLDISDNPITKIFMEDFSDLPALKVLKMNHLQIKTVPDFTFSSLKSLVHLELERNLNLSRFSKFAFGQDVLEDADDFALEIFSIKGSQIRILDKDLIEPFGQLVTLDLQGNPWKCDCKLTWIKQLQIPDKYYQDLRCSYPPQLSNEQIFKVDLQLMVCPVRTHYIGMLVGGTSLCIILACLALWIFVFLPKCQSRSMHMKDLIAPTAAYSILPLGVNREPYFE